jgi:uncharacterized membrane protein HdeD (DUF308 family)
MALEEFEKEELSNRDKGLVRMQSISNYVMGILIIAAGILFLIQPGIVKEKLKYNDPLLITILGVLCVIYGLFRIYRGYKKNYFRN